MKADLLFLNGEVITVDSNFSIYDSVAVKGDRILEVGTFEEMKKFISEDTKIVDLNGKSLLPGFIDSHLHIQQYGLYKLAYDLSECTSISELKEILCQNIEDIPPGNWIRGWGYNDNNVVENRLPVRSELDEISTKHPIYIQRSCGHVLSANSYALELAGIGADSVNPEGGEIAKENGVPTGVLKEAARMAVIDRDTYTDEEVLRAFQLAAEDYNRVGITSVHDLGAKFKKPNEHFLLLQKATKQEDFNVRIYATVVSYDNSSDAIDNMLEAGILSGLGNEKFKVGPSKLFLDGSITGQTAAMKNGYVNNRDNKGIAYLEQQTINNILEKPHLAGSQISAHAIGDRAVEMMLNCIESAINLDKRENHRHRIEHASVTSPELLDRMRDLKVVVVPNPAFFYPYGEEYIKYIGEKAYSMFPIRSLLDKGIVVAGGSDSPIADNNPMIGIYETVNRKTKNGTSMGENECVSIEEAIRIFTYNGAYASFEEDIKGSIEPGKLADLVVMSESILNCPKEDLLRLKVEKTVFNGKIVFEEEEN